MFRTYDDWKLASPEDESPLWDDDYECPHCGARLGQGCLLEDEMDAPPCVEQRDPDADRQQREDDRADQEHEARRDEEMEWERDREQDR